ncbi:MAG: hypothetical protein QOD32_2988 [Pyrinomonadaceae bacterium]|jgi:hypothetical protein|nr:hypothetical protein [Pyrinomonadaceae bacterium]
MAARASYHSPFKMSKKIKQGNHARPSSSAAASAARVAQVSRVFVACVLVAFMLGAGGCRRVSEKLGISAVRPRELRDVPAARLAFRLETDRDEVVPEPLKTDTPEELLAPVKAQFETSRKDEALLRTVVSPDGQRALALYDPGGGQPADNTFRIDLYGADGMFVRNILPPNLEGITLSAVAWSPDAQWIAFIGRERPNATPSPTPPDELPSAPPTFDPNASPVPTASVAPFIAPVPVFKTDQIYVADRNGENLRPLTTRDGLIYLNLAWSPDSRALAALACRQDELDARMNEGREFAGRPRIIERADGKERLLDDQLMDAPLVWSPDSAKVATATETDVAIYDAAGNAPTGARLPLRDALLNASAAYDASKLKRAGGAATTTADGKANSSGDPAAAASSSSGTPISFNPIIRLEWLQPETLLVRTGFVRYYQNSPEPTRGYLRWHVLHLSPQAVVLS